MLELVRTRASVISCLASPEALAELSTPEGTYLCWVASDEAMLVGPRADAAHLVRDARTSVAGSDADAIVLDVSDGWALWTLGGSAAREAFSRLSELEIEGEGYLQGDVARVPVRVVSRAERLHLLVPAMWEEHLRSRIRMQAGDLDLRESPSAGWSIA